MAHIFREKNESVLFSFGLFLDEVRRLVQKNGRERISPWNLLQTINFATDEQLLYIKPL